MPLEERIQKSVDSALAGMRDRIEDEVRSAITQIITAATAERDEAIAAAVELARADAALNAQLQANAAERRVRASVDELVEKALADERAAAADNLKNERALAAENLKNERALAAENLKTALQSSRDELKQAISEAQHRADEALRESVTAARVRERELEMAAISRLLESIRGLDGASSLSEVLDALGQASAREASRTAVLVVRSERLLGWKLSGFGTRDAQPKLIDLALSEAGVIGVAVTSARAATTRDSAAAAPGPGFATLPDDRMGLGVPVIVGGRVVAVVYADGVTEEGNEKLVPSGWPEVIEILTRHAARCLESLTSQKSASATPSPRLWVPPPGKTSPEGGETPANPESPGAAKPDARSEGTA
jgi:hypothetical protein